MKKYLMGLVCLASLFACASEGFAHGGHGGHGGNTYVHNSYHNDYHGGHGWHDHYWGGYGYADPYWGGVYQGWAGDPYYAYPYNGQPVGEVSVNINVAGE